MLNKVPLKINNVTFTLKNFNELKSVLDQTITINANIKLFINVVEENQISTSPIC
jgi:hypothetical protein